MPRNVTCEKCNNYRHNWCEMVRDDPDPDIVRDCSYFWEKTNADRIRAMSDEELAEYLFRDPMKMLCRGKIERTESCSEYGCRGCALEWLQQPAEGE